jgi:hypothetical protein
VAGEDVRLPKTHLVARTKFKIAVSVMAAAFETSSGNPAYCLNSHVNRAFEAMETNPLAT